MSLNFVFFIYFEVENLILMNIFEYHSFRDISIINTQFLLSIHFMNFILTKFQKIIYICF